MACMEELGATLAAIHRQHRRRALRICLITNALSITLTALVCFAFSAGQNTAQGRNNSTIQFACTSYWGSGPSVL